MKFTHLVIIKQSPWYVYCMNEEDAKSIAEQFKANTVGVVVAEGGLEMKEFATTFSLRPVVTKQIPFLNEAERPSLLNEDEEELIKEEILDENDITECN